MAEKYGVIRLDNVSAPTDGSYLRSFRYMGTDGTTETEIENGSAVILNGLLNGERETYKGVAPTADDKGVVAIVCSPELIYDEIKKKDLWDFINPVGGVAPRAFIPTKGDIFSITKLDGTKAKNDVVCLQNSTKLTSMASTTSETVVGKILDIELVGQLTYYVIEV